MIKKFLTRESNKAQKPKAKATTAPSSPLLLSLHRSPQRSKMVAANREMVVFCFDVLVAHYNRDQVPVPAFDEATHPLFVTWKTAVNGYEPCLRGCVGTLEARALIDGFKDYALTSALKDRRFPPIHPRELPQLQCTVSVLTNYECSLHYLDWEIGKHGLIIEFLDPYHDEWRSGTYLPEVAAQAGWTKEEAIDSLMRKAGYQGTIVEGLRQQVNVTRYQSTLCTMHYNEYVSYVQLTRGSTPALVRKA